MPLFGDSVPAAVVERFLDVLEQERKRSHEVTLEALAIKRHEMQMPGKDWQPPKDPFESLGRKTQVAIDTFAMGDRELRARLIGFATNMAAGLALQELEPDEIDEQVAERVEAGDT